MSSTITEEQWTPTTIKAGFVLRFPSRVPRPGGISIDLPLLNLGWTFTLSLTPARRGTRKQIDQWLPAAFSFKQQNGIRWGSTSIHAQLSLSLGVYSMDVVLADTCSLQLPLVAPCTISSLQPNKVWLTVTISNCPLPNGLFDARFDPVNEAQVQAQLVRQSGDRVLSRSLSTGKLFDVKFLTTSTRSASGNTARSLPTYASLSVLEDHVDIPSAIIGDRWTSALAALGNTNVKNIGEISCPDDYEYELDSDYEDEDEACESTHKPSKIDTEMFSGSLSSFELEGATEHGSDDRQLGEAIKGLKELPSDYERTIRIKFAAHRTWHAFLWYCYTGKLEFGKLTSQVEPGGQHLRVTPLEGGPPTCSPKSMYRLADLASILVGDKELKVKALAVIKERMTKENVLDEAFSVFTSKYPDVRQVQLGVLMEHCGSPSAKEAFLRVMKQYANMPHAQPVLSAFYDGLVA